MEHALEPVKEFPKPYVQRIPGAYRLELCRIDDRTVKKAYIVLAG